MSRLWVRADGFLVVECDYEQRGVVKEIGGRWDCVEKAWTVAFTSSNVEHLLDSLDCPSVDKSVEESLHTQSNKEARLTKLREMSKMDVQVKLRVPGLKDNCKLYNYQKLGVVYALTNEEGVLIADEMGLGKTLQALAAALIRKAKGHAKTCLVITPASLKYNWPIEIAKFTDEKFVVIDGTPEERISQWMRSDVFFFVVNYELLLEDLFGGREFKFREGDDEAKIAKLKERKAKAEIRKRILTGIRQRSWDVIIIDEAHAIKSHQSARSRNVKQMNGKFRMALTGTPMDGRLEELHSVMEFVYPGLLESRTRFLQKHAETDFWGKITGYKNIDIVRKRIAHCFLRRLKKDVLKDLPDKIYENRIVVLTPDEQRIYKELASQGHAVTQDVEAMVKVIRCKQFCDHFSLIGEDCKTSSKLEALRDVLTEIVVENGHKVLIFSQYKQMLEILVKLLDEMKLKYLRIDGDTPKKLRADMQVTFNTDNKLDVMIGTEAMSTGLNFTAADYVINYDDNWAPAIMNQRSDRAHRIGQKCVVTVVSFICRDTIEERIRDVLYSKECVSAEVLGDETDETILRRLGPKDIAKLL
jgi:SNF2 family DNA or RNA helicase